MRNRREFYALLGVFCLLGTGMAGFIAWISYMWATTGAEWFTIFGYEFHKISFAVGVAAGAIFLGGSTGVHANVER